MNILYKFVLELFYGALLGGKKEIWYNRDITHKLNNIWVRVENMKHCAHMLFKLHEQM